MNSKNMYLKVREIHKYESAKCYDLMNMNLQSAMNAWIWIWQVPWIHEYEARKFVN